MTAAMSTSREIRLKSRPVGMPTPEDFELATADVAAPGPGEVQVKNLWMSVDPYMRGRMTDRESYVPPFELGKALQGGAVGEVTASNDPNFKPGDLVSTMLGWREGFTAAPAASGMQKIETYGLPPQAFLGVAGMPGLTAYVGLLKIGLMKEGETVFVSAAAGGGRPDRLPDRQDQRRRGDRHGRRRGEMRLPKGNRRRPCDRLQG